MLFLNEKEIIKLEQKKIILIFDFSKFSNCDNNFKHTNFLLIGKIRDVKNKKGYQFNYFGFDFKKNTIIFKRLFIHTKNLLNSYSHDLVLCCKQKNYFQKFRTTRYEAFVLKMLKREFSNVIGYVYKENNILKFKILNSKLQNLEAQIININNAFQKNNHAFKAKIIDYQPYKYLFSILLEDDLGDFNKNETKFKTIIAENDMNFQFDKDVLYEAKQLPKTLNLENVTDLNERKDLTNLEFVSIDGVDAKDLDDAIYVREDKNGFNLKVAIADVSYYVKRKSLIDLSAKTQTSSMYLVNYVKPMLPVELSNNLCSLNYNKKRLVLVLDCNLDINGKVLNSKVYKGIINSFARLNYDEVNLFFENKELNSSTLDLLKVKTLLNSAKKLYQILNKNNDAKGFISLNSFESSFEIDPKTNKVINVYVKKRAQSEKLIETFMILANQEIAKILSSKKIPALYRIHNCPKNDKLMFLKEQLDEYKIPISDLNYLRDQKKLKHYITLLNQKSLPIVSSLIFLRSMQKASYSSINKGHFCLCSKYYTHFTSPIRRYPDLIVHRLLKTFILNKKYTPEDLLKYKVYVNEIIKASKNKEPIILNIEREASKLKKCEFLIDKFNLVFEGVIISVLPFGFYVMLENGIEGFVHVSTLKDDFYNFDEKNFELCGDKNKNKYRFGNQVKVKLRNVNVIKRVIDFELV